MVAEFVNKTAASLMRDALTAARSGRPSDACALAEEALAAGGDPVPINALLGMVRLDLGETERAIDHLQVVFDRRPSDIKIATDLATALATAGLFERAFEVAGHDLAFADPTFQLARLRGAIAVQLKNVEVAEEALSYVLSAVPNDWESWNALGNARFARGDYGAAAQAFDRALSIHPAAPEIRMNYAGALRELARFDEAEAIYRGVGVDFADNPAPFRELHFLLKDLRRDREALEAIAAAVERAPDDPKLLVDKANHLATLQQMTDAEELYRRALEIDPADSAAWVGLALMHELTNRVDELLGLADEAELEGAQDAASFIRAYHHRRARQFYQGLTALQSVPEDLEPARRLHLLGQLLEGAERYDEAFAAFSEMNEKFAQDTSRPHERAATYRDTVRGFRTAATAEWARMWRAETELDTRPSPVFLVGFPRSGTTLLDTFLMSHPEIEVLEEEPALRTAMDLLPSFAALPTLNEEQIAAARDRYFDTVASLRPMQPGKLLIDKNPLTMNLLPFARRIFPDARVILALRHPCDVVLSCFMANFRLNEGMSSFISLDTTAELYDLSFAYYEQVQSLMPFPTHIVKYENVVVDQQRELEPLLSFLQLDWHEAVLDHQSTALKRGRIKTVSYAQVVQPIYTRAAGRWEHYRKRLEPVLPVLRPWIDKFGYEI